MLKLWRNALVSISFAVLGAQNPPAHHPLTFRIHLAREAADHSISGRMIVLLSPEPPRGAIFAPVEEPEIWIAAQEVRNLEPGSSVEISGDMVGRAPFQEIPLRSNRKARGQLQHRGAFGILV